MATARRAAARSSSRAPARPAQGDSLAASYQTRQFTVPAGGSAFADVHVRLVAVLTLVGADSFLIRLNDGATGLCFESWQFRTVDRYGIRKLELINPGGAPITVVLALARSGELVDGRFALPSALSVDVAAQSFSPLVVDLATPADYTDASGQNANNSPYGASYLVVQPGGGGVTTLFLPAANTGGAIIRTVCGISAGNLPVLYADTAAPAAWNSTNRRPIWFGNAVSTPFLPYPLFVPAGDGAWIAYNGSGVYSATWDLL